MNSLPSQPQTDTSLPNTAPPASQSPGAGLGAKETGPALGSVRPEQSGLIETGKDIELPKEVASQGVRISPTQVAVPQKLAAAGVQPAGDNVTVGSGQTVTLPLTDDQIAQGLTQSVSSSWRWLAEWCRRKLKQIALSLQNTGRSRVRGTQ